ncbi:DUF4148 domain-containing protein [Burkholderia ubonensis]|uniref:DUF4148 domain-containing protein n=1 Tax=Burkholderia ubonensis TaxID=101571 RepID=UPI000759330A|nr:DUF4148 domain-containing protein [Burkholderia ubonensis]
MNTRISTGISLAIFAFSIVATHVSAQELTRSQVRQELIQSINDGARFVTDTSYPVVSPLYRQPVESVAPVPQATSDTTTRDRADTGSNDEAPEPCVGPQSFCDIYGS